MIALVLLAAGIAGVVLLKQHEAAPPLVPSTTLPRGRGQSSVDRARDRLLQTSVAATQAVAAVEVARAAMAAAGVMDLAALRRDFGTAQAALDAALIDQRAAQATFAAFGAAR